MVENEHCKYIACKKGNFSIPFFPILFQCTFGSENNVKFILKWFLKLPYSMVVCTCIM